MSLDQIIIPGGGQNDLWHNLNCKGRYAGEVRIELTYYDTRPRDEKAEERRQSAPISGAVEQGSSGVCGPRQPKPVKRRPLPSDPTSSTHSSPLPHTPSNIAQRSVPQQRYVESPNDYDFESTPPPARRHQHLQDGPQQSSPFTNNLQHPDPYNGNAALAPASNQATPDQFTIYDSPGQGDYQKGANIMSNQSPQPYDPSSGYDTEYDDASQSRPLTQPVHTSNGIIHSNLSPAIIDVRPHQKVALAQQYPRSTPPKGHSYDESPTSQYSRDDGYGAWPNRDGGAVDEDAAPPAPPAHRHSGSRRSPQSQGRMLPESYAPIPAPPPLNIRNGRGSVGGSPLSQVQKQCFVSRIPVDITNPFAILSQPCSFRFLSHVIQSIRQPTITISGQRLRTNATQSSAGIRAQYCRGRVGENHAREPHKCAAAVCRPPIAATSAGTITSYTDKTAAIATIPSSTSISTSRTDETTANISQRPERPRQASTSILCSDYQPADSEPGSSDTNS